MKKFTVVMIVILLTCFEGIGQFTVNRIVVGAGGIYGNPDDHVMINGYDPASQNSSVIGEVFRESIQDMVIAGDYAYVAAEDSIVKFDLINNTKIAAVYESNLSRLFYHNQFLYVSRRSDINGAPVDGIYLKVFYAYNLEHFYDVEGINADAAGIAVANDSIYVAVPGDWMSTEGRLAILSADLELDTLINLGSGAVGISDLFVTEEKLYSVNRSPYLSIQGSVTEYFFNTGDWQNHVFDHIVGRGVEIINNELFLVMDYGIGYFDLNTGTLSDSLLIDDPGSSSFLYIADAVYDHDDSLFYVSITDYFSTGYGKIYNLSGTETGSFEAGISAEALAVQYELNSAVNEHPSAQSTIHVYPNPVAEHLTIEGNEPLVKINIYDSYGRELYKIRPELKNSITLNLGFLYSGIYFVKVQTASSEELKKIIVR